MDNPVATAILLAFPQMLLILYAPLGLVGAKTPLRKLLLPALLLTVLVSVTRLVPGLFGWHIPIFLIGYVATATLFHLTSLIASVASAALSFILIALGDVAIAVPVLSIFDLGLDSTMSSWTIRVAFGWLEAVFLILASLLVKYKSFVLIPIAKRPGGLIDPGEHA